MPSVVLLRVLAVVLVPPTSAAAGAAAASGSTAVHFDVMNAQGQRSIKGGVVVLNGTARGSANAAVPRPTPSDGDDAGPVVLAGTGPESGNRAVGASHVGRRGSTITMSLTRQYGVLLLLLLFLLFLLFSPLFSLALRASRHTDLHRLFLSA